MILVGLCQKKKNSINANNQHNELRKHLIWSNFRHRNNLSIVILEFAKETYWKLSSPKWILFCFLKRILYSILFSLSLPLFCSVYFTDQQYVRYDLVEWHLCGYVQPTELKVILYPGSIVGTVHHASAVIFSYSRFVIHNLWGKK